MEQLKKIFGQREEEKSEIIKPDAAPSSEDKKDAEKKEPANTEEKQKVDDEHDNILKIMVTKMVDPKEVLETIKKYEVSPDGVVRRRANQEDK